MPRERRGHRPGTKRVVVGIESHWDASTKPAWKYRKKNVYPYLRRQGLKIDLLPGARARRKGAAAAAKKWHDAYLTGSGHGESYKFTGDRGERIFEVGYYERAESDGKVAHFLSCDTAQQLGPDFVSHGCRAYFGYDVDFAWPEQADPAPFFRCDAEIDFALADGETAKRALERTRKEFDRWIGELNLVKGDTGAAGSLATLRDHLFGPSRDRRYGNPAARLR